MASLTTNYSFNLPVVGGDTDAWGSELNANWTSIDGTLHTVSGVANAAQTTANAALPAAGGTLTGPLTGTSATFSGTVTSANLSAPQAIGDNRIINGNFVINQRVQVSGTAIAAAAYGHDRWKAGTGGCTYTFTNTLPDTTITITAGTLTQVIEAGLIEGGVYTLSWTGTAQARVYQGTPTGSYAASPIVTASQPAGTNTIVEFNTGTLGLVKFEIGTIATRFNRQSLAKVIADCQRYYQVLGGIQAGDIMLRGYIANAGSPLSSTIYFAPMRATPTATAVGSFTLTNTTAISLAPSSNTLGMSVSATAAGQTGFVSAGTSTYITLSAEL